MAKFCTNCGNELDDRAIMCPKCGIALTQTVALHRRGLQPLPGRAGQLRPRGHRHAGEGDGGPSGRAGGHPRGLYAGDGTLPHRQQRPCQPLPEPDRVPGLHRRRAAGHHTPAGRGQGLPAGRELQCAASGLLPAPSGAGRPHGGQRTPRPQHAGKGHLLPEPPPRG